MIMDKPIIQLEPPPTITLPLPLFLSILWGYKKGAELRERAVPGREIISILKAVPRVCEFVHIQEQEGCEDTVWQLAEWKSAGLRQETRKKELGVLWAGIDSVIDTLAPKFPMFNREGLRVFADGLIAEKQWATLQQFGVDTTELEKVVK